MAAVVVAAVDAAEATRAVLLPGMFGAMAAASSLELFEGEEEDVEDSSPFDEVDEAAGGRVHVKKLVEIISGF